MRELAPLGDLDVWGCGHCMTVQTDGMRCKSCGRPRDESIPGYQFSHPPPRRPQWRYARERTELAWEQQLRREAEMHIDVSYELPNGKRKRPDRMTRSEIGALSRREAEKDVQHAINDWNSHQVAARRAVRRGEAY
jgi:hypothetical protein